VQSVVSRSIHRVRRDAVQGQRSTIYVASRLAGSARVGCRNLVTHASARASLEKRVGASARRARHRLINNHPRIGIAQRVTSVRR
jgi:hypothetical protein